MQQLCQEGLGWYEPVPDERLDTWERWLGKLACLDTLTISRSVRPAGFKPRQTQLHCFCDASKDNYGAVAYMRTVDVSGATHCCFLMGKSRVTPVKPVTIPRLELTAAVVGVKLVQCIKREMDLSIDDVIYGTDSTAVLQYIRNTARRFQTFVANRLSVIQEASRPAQWRHADSNQTVVTETDTGQTDSNHTVA